MLSPVVQGASGIDIIEKADSLSDVEDPAQIPGLMSRQVDSDPFIAQVMRDDHLSTPFRRPFRRCTLAQTISEFVGRARPKTPKIAL